MTTTPTSPHWIDDLLVELRPVADAYARLAKDIVQSFAAVGRRVRERRQQHLEYLASPDGVAERTVAPIAAHERRIGRDHVRSQFADLYVELGLPVPTDLARYASKETR